MHPLIQEIWRLRQDERDPLAALDAALDLFKTHAQRPELPLVQDCWHEHFAGGSCLLLESARAAWASPDELQPRLRRLEALAEELKDGLLYGSLPLVQTRLELLAALNRPDLDLPSLTDALVQAARAYADQFACPGVNYTNSAPPQPPAFLASLPNGEKWSAVFAALAKELGWQNPGLLMAGETVRYLYGSDDAPAGDPTAQTWILLADMRNIPNGVLARLRLRRWDGGCGGLFPDPASAGYTRLDPTFRTGLANARSAAWGMESPDFDVTWTVELVDPPSELRNLPIRGRSAEAAIRCGLRALEAGERLDQCVAITARLEPGPLGWRLSEVGAIDRKTLAKALKEKKIAQILVAADQSEIRRNQGRPVEIGNGEIQLVPVADVDQAYTALARWERITGRAKRELAADAARRIEDLCGHYVVPSLSRPAPQRALKRGTRDEATPPEADEPYDPLSPNEVAQLLAGRLPHPRTLLLAHSGLGKSVLLVECQRQMAEQPDGPLPVRLGGLSELPWHDPPAVRRRMADSLTPFLPPEVKEAERWQWFERLVDAGRVVFLLDALDQTIRDKLDGMSSFLAHGIGDCRVLMTGRPYVTDTRQNALNADAAFEYRDDRRWTQLRLDKFDEPQQRQFLGEWAGAVLETEEEHRSRWRHRESIARKQRWAALVDQPLLLKMLRDLAASPGGLEDICNRYDVYTRAVEQLIDKGWTSLQKSELGPKVFQSPGDVQRGLRQIAWNRAQAGDFRGVVEGEDLDQLMKAVKHLQQTDGSARELRDALDQMNVVTCGGIVESGQEVRLAWRHFSFCEYFAGLELARNYPRGRMMSPPTGLTYDRVAENEYAAAVQANARSDAWRAVFRYALSHLAATNQVERLVALAKDLIQFGSPFVVAQAIREDGVRLPDDLDRLCRWLVHQDWGWEQMWTKDADRPDMDSETAALLDSAFVPGRRDSRYLHSAWELVSGSELELCRCIRDRFLGEFPQLLRSGNPIAFDIRDGFQEIPPADDPLRRTMRFAVGPSEGEESYDWEGRRRWVSLEATFEIARTPVTNAQFELFAPDHQERRTKYSIDPDCPVVQVTWYEAELFCVWLGAIGDGQACRLPTETEWEIACRAGSEGPYCRIREPDGSVRDLVTEDDLRLVAHFDSDAGTLPVAKGREPNAWGLFDMLGNVWEWCSDWFDMAGPTSPATGSDRVSRGGGWSSRPGHCRSAYRRGDSPEYRFHGLGFRVARSSVGSSDKRSL